MKTILIQLENKIGVLEKLTNVFSRNRVNIERLTLTVSDKPGISEMTIVINMEEKVVAKILLQIKKIIEVASVKLA